MFINQSHQPQELDVSDYYSPEQHAREVERLFRPQWHCVATRAEMANDGDFLTTELLGHPLLIWNREGTIHTFLNVCAHRYSMLTSQPRGSLQRLKCQYHGWEYEADGSTSRIPDARSFRPLAKEMACLRKFPTELCGGLIFVTLNDHAPSLEQSLGPGYRHCREWFSEAWRPTLSLEQHLDVNWKLLLENVLENYHLTEVHGGTFQVMPPEEVCDHELGENWSSFIERPDSKHSPLKSLGDAVCRILDVQPRAGIEHFHGYPNLVMANMGLFTWVQVAQPLGPARSRNWWRFFHYAGASPSPPARLVTALLKRWGRRFFQRVLNEDRAILPDVQRGLQCRTLPTGGLLSTREERIAHFQHYVKQATRGQSGGRPGQERKDATFSFR